MTLTVTLKDRNCAHHIPTTICIIVLKWQRGPALPASHAPDPDVGKKAVCPLNPAEFDQAPVYEALEKSGKFAAHSGACKIMHPGGTGGAKPLCATLGRAWPQTWRQA